MIDAHSIKRFQRENETLLTYNFSNWRAKTNGNDVRDVGWLYKEKVVVFTWHVLAVQDFVMTAE